MNRALVRTAGAKAGHPCLEPAVRNGFAGASAVPQSDTAEVRWRGRTAGSKAGHPCLEPAVRNGFRRGFRRTPTRYRGSPLARTDRGLQSRIYRRETRESHTTRSAQTSLRHYPAASAPSNQPFFALTEATLPPS